MNMSLGAWFFASSCLLFSFHADADWFHKKVSYQCRAKDSLLIIRYDGAYNEVGKLMLARKGKNEWDPWELLRKNADGSLITGAKSVSRVCAIGEKKISVTISGVFENARPSAKCGSHVTARVKIQSEGKALFDQVLEGGCDNTFTDDVVKEVRLSSDRLEVTRVRGNDFYSLNQTDAVPSQSPPN